MQITRCFLLKIENCRWLEKYSQKRSFYLLIILFIYLIIQNIYLQYIQLTLFSRNLQTLTFLYLKFGGFLNNFRLSFATIASKRASIFFSTVEAVSK